MPLLFGAAGEQPAAPGVRVWEEDKVIPTYLIGDPEPNPIFYFGKQSQGAQGRVYPYPLYDNLTFQKTDKHYKVVYLENEFVRIGILPEVGGRLFEGVDKTNNYNFIYRQHVIKPALIGLIGAWISGGIEWNIPHHHRATSALPVQYQTEENADGSKTIWVGELEMRSRMRWAVGYTLRPGKAYLEAKVRIVNRTPVVNTMLCFANVAVHVNENYQVFFPPSTQYGTYHSKTQFTKWPVSDSRYQAADFTKGVDISWYKNHITSNSIFAWNYEDDFFAGYDHGKKAGIMSVADHHMVPGKKLWTWGNGAAGRQWDHILTDNDGPYIELMVGAYSDNQPDYSWLQPERDQVVQHVLVSLPRNRRRQEGESGCRRESGRRQWPRQGRLLHDRESRRRQRAAQGRRPGPARREDGDRARETLYEGDCGSGRNRRARPARLDLGERQGAGGVLADPPEAGADAEAAVDCRRARPSRSRRPKNCISPDSASSSSTIPVSTRWRTGRRPCAATPATSASIPRWGIARSNRPASPKPNGSSAKRSSA